MTTPTAEERLAVRLAYDHGHFVDDDGWERAPADLRKDYRDLARAALAVLGGPTEAQQEAAALAAEVRELTRQRDRYRDAWLSACRRSSTVPVPKEAFTALVRVAMWVSRGRSMAFTPDPNPLLGPTYPDVSARRALGALDDAGLLQQFRTSP